VIFSGGNELFSLPRVADRAARIARQALWRRRRRCLQVAPAAAAAGRRMAQTVDHSHQRLPCPATTPPSQSRNNLHDVNIAQFDASYLALRNTERSNFWKEPAFRGENKHLFIV